VRTPWIRPPVPSRVAPSRTATGPKWTTFANSTTPLTDAVPVKDCCPDSRTLPDQPSSTSRGVPSSPIGPEMTVRTVPNDRICATGERRVIGPLNVAPPAESQSWPASATWPAYTPAGSVASAVPPTSTSIGSAPQPVEERTLPARTTVP
jgi:hypothetical protein